MKWPAFIVGLVAVLVIVSIRTGLVGDCIGIGGLLWYSLLPFIDRKRVRARWASLAILFSGLLGVGMATVSLSLHGRWLVVDDHANSVIHYWLSFGHGIFLGVSFALMLSGQLFGTKRLDTTQPPNTALEPTATAPPVSTLAPKLERHRSILSLLSGGRGSALDR